MPPPGGMAPVSENTHNSTTNTLLLRSVSIVSIFEFSIRESQIRTNLLRMFLLTRCRISMCQGLGPKKHDEISKIDRTLYYTVPYHNCSYNRYYNYDYNTLNTHNWLGSEHGPERIRHKHNYDTLNCTMPRSSTTCCTTPRPLSWSPGPRCPAWDYIITILRIHP